ncbi:MAG: hypothetical protein A2297_01585 [Elusimicrobia bacterium RIFOXYB2_FULL_48_7]|nr:MAG: hypothetical protein A2297_01585 [Elusimicrobia bacterium RIFOXYB2_FULL_48_7]
MNVRSIPAPIRMMPFCRIFTEGWFGVVVIHVPVPAGTETISLSLAAFIADCTADCEQSEA